MPAPGMTVLIEEMLMIRPPSRSRTAASRMDRNVPLALTVMTWSQSSSLVSAISPTVTVLALFTTMSRPSLLRSASSNSVTTSTALPWSARTAKARPPASATARTTAPAASASWTKLKVTVAPSRASRSTTARPIPRAPPVTTAPLPTKTVMPTTLADVSERSSRPNAHDPADPPAGHSIRTAENVAARRNPNHAGPATRQSPCTSGQLRELLAGSGVSSRSWWLIRRLCGEAESEACQVAGPAPVQGGAGPVGMQAEEVERAGHVHVVEAGLGQAAVAGAPCAVAGGLVHGALHAGAAGVVSLEGDRVFGGAGGGLRLGQVAGRHGELAPVLAAGGAQAAGRARAAVAGGEGRHDRVLAGLGAGRPGHRGPALRAGNGFAVVVDGEVGAGVAVAGPGLGRSVRQQRPDQRDAVPGGFADQQSRAEVPRIEVMPSRCQGLPRQLVVDDDGHLVVSHRGIGGGHVRDQVRERRGRAVLVMAAAASPALAGAAAPRLVIAGLGDVQLVSQPEGVPLDTPPVG